MSSIKSLARFAVLFLASSSAEAFIPRHPLAHRNAMTTAIQASQKNNNGLDGVSSDFSQKLKAVTTAGLLCASAFLSPLPAIADGSRVVGQIAGSGIVFKDTLQVESFEDPKIRGVRLYISTFQRPLNERLSSAKNFFSDPSSSAVACAKTTSKVQIADNINKTPNGEEVFQESKSLLFKSLRVQRIYDTETNTVVYVSFNTRFDKGDDSNKSRFQNALCAVNLNDDYNEGKPAAAAATTDVAVLEAAVAN